MCSSAPGNAPLLHCTLGLIIAALCKIKRWKRIRNKNKPPFLEQKGGLKKCYLSGIQENT
ncbi:TPA: hypothetical protein HL449_04105 [Escherichia coli]|uniref:Uncharacterized protein n=2 Tax=Pseudomonadati TaxID=3379134 RepID=A0A148HVS6_ECOLX|nr:hypothetical protein AM456_25600 [Escherichia coli]EFJ79246.1 hypothetical protein HMPREF9534_04770 [Escherichia coli MS 69-1]EFN8405477.1 hypothetical protein [Escherichia coli O15]ESA92026.1 hypothetical protein HMPREF1599_01448 [Escherichia coli 907713]ESD30828.1 hypothetical protein HMPREF1600_00502 [Escherichia coli 907715]ESD32316.1 hypothetical protein HMPREF1602_04698 [Escherichia coli 907889]ESD53852.1 hypothetical protein HMPREF1606_03283 [Escherichia coli 908522]ESD57146.1 hypo